MIIPQTKSVREILKYQDFSNYTLKIKKEESGIKLQGIELMYGEI